MELPWYTYTLMCCEMKMSQPLSRLLLSGHFLNNSLIIPEESDIEENDQNLRLGRPKHTVYHHPLDMFNIFSQRRS